MAMKRHNPLALLLSRPTASDQFKDVPLVFAVSADACGRQPGVHWVGHQPIIVYRGDDFDPRTYGIDGNVTKVLEINPFKLPLVLEPMAEGKSQEERDRMAVSVNTPGFGDALRAEIRARVEQRAARRREEASNGTTV